VFEASVAAAIAGGTFISDRPNPGLHPGMSSFGGRQNRVLNSLQVGGGPLGAFADIDRGNPQSGVIGFLVHAGEMLMPGRTNPFAVGRALGKTITGYECRPRK